MSSDYGQVEAEAATSEASEPDEPSGVDEESIKAYLEALSPAECRFAFEQLKAKYEGDEGTKYSMADIAAGK